MTMRMSIPVEERVPAPSLADRAVAWWRLFLIEMRRSPAVVGALLVALVTGFIMWDSLLEGVIRWQEINDSAADIAPIYASTVVAAFAAYRAGSIRQHRMTEQVGSTSYNPALHDIAGFLPVAVWSVIGYLVPVAAFYLYAALQATWGGPDLMRPAVGVATLIVSAAFGWLVGTAIRHRIAPLVAIVSLLVLHLADDFTRSYRVERVQFSPTSWGSQARDGWWHHLVPGNVLMAEYAGDVALRAIGWLLCLAVVLWLAAAVVRDTSRTRLLASVASVIVAVLAATSVVAFERPERVTGNQVVFEDLQCTSRLHGQIRICVHPENAALLDATADAVEPVAEALLGVPDAPTLFIEGMGMRAQEHGGVQLSLYDYSTVRGGQLQRVLVSDVVYAESRDPENTVLTSPQHVVAAWLLGEVGQDTDIAVGEGVLAPMWSLYHQEAAIYEGLTLSEYNEHLNADIASRNPNDAAIEKFEADVEDATDRFIAMPDDDRTAWLTENWDALVSGHLTLEDLP
jgi:hypothetical protein